MESLDELTKTSSGKPGFFKHVFNFNDESKSIMLNIVQYAVLAVIPVVILNKITQNYVPEADDDKSSLELTAEILAQIIIMFVSILFIHRIVTYVPTYSGEKYADFNVTNIVLAMLVILLSLQTKLGEKISILVDRIVELWEGKKKGSKKGNNQVKVSQPISQPISQMSIAPQMAGATSINSLPTQQMPDYNQMYQQDNTPLVGAATPAMGMGMESFEPMAANSVGGGAFGSAFGGGW
uniref:Uncharacterized protein n=1 Tax=viral metagenome TaxID=1070528 RepID=A0A6C0IR82_9ZZZZ